MTLTVTITPDRTSVIASTNDKDDVLQAVNEIIKAHRLTEVDAMGLDFVKTQKLNGWIEQY